MNRKSKEAITTWLLLKESMGHTCPPALATALTQRLPVPRKVPKRHISWAEYCERFLGGWLATEVLSGGMPLEAAIQLYHGLKGTEKVVPAVHDEQVIPHDVVELVHRHPRPSVVLAAYRASRYATLRAWLRWDDEAVEVLVQANYAQYITRGFEGNGPRSDVIDILLSAQAYLQPPGTRHSRRYSAWSPEREDQAARTVKAIDGLLARL